MGRKFIGLGIILCFFLAVPLSLWPGSARAADREIEQLREQIKKLQERIDKIEKKRAQEAKERQNWKVQWKNGFRVEYKVPEKKREYRLRFRTGIQFRYTYVDTDNEIKRYDLPYDKNMVDHSENYSSFNMRRLRFFVDGTAPNRDWKYYVHLQLEPQGAVNTHDAFVQWQHWKEFRVQFGRMKIPAFGMEYWQSGFKQNGTDRTIFTGDSEFDKDLFGQRTFDFPGSNARLRVGNHRLKNGFPAGGFLLYRSQGLNVNGNLDLLGRKQFLAYWLGVYNGRDTRAFNNPDDRMLYSLRLGVNFLPGSDPKGPLGPKGFNNYFMQGDYGYNTRPLAAFITSAFLDKDKTKNRFEVTNNASAGFMKWNKSAEHDIDNYGFTGTLLFRYLGFSADLEGAWEEFRQDPGSGDSGTADEETWDRWGVRANLGYFFVPKKWEATFKFAYVERLDNSTLVDSIKSGLGLVKLDDGFATEDNLQQYVFGLNYYWHGFNHYITADVGLYRREFNTVSSSEAAALGLDPAAFSPDPDTQTDVRVRVMHQFWF